MVSTNPIQSVNLGSSFSHDRVMELRGVSKVYKLYTRAVHRVIETFLPGIGREYHQKFHALEDVSFSIERGQTVGIIGQNGSGKSTLLQIICGILQPSCGELMVDGRISALLELGAGFNPDFTGRENVYLNGSILGVSKNEMDECFDDITAFADIGEFIDQPVKMYSSGMYVRLAFAVAINVKPDILIVDEALSVGDTAFQAKCFAKFQEFQENGVTILFVTHSMDLVTRYCSNAILLDHGRVAKSGAAKDVVDEYNRRLVQCSKGKAGDNAGADESKSDNESHDALYNQTHDGELGYQLNPSENRYGNGKAEIIQVGIESLSDTVKHSFVHGESYRFWFKTRFHSRLENPITAFTIKDVKGFDLTGTNTLFKDVHIGIVEEGDVILTQFDQKMILNPGGYLLSFGCAGFDDGKYVVYDRRYDVITFEVISDVESAGIFDMNSHISVTRVEE